MSDVINTTATPSTDPSIPPESMVQISHITYALFALGLVTGIFSIAGLIVAYVKREDAAGTYLASHYSWLIRTFWWFVLWAALTGLFVIVTFGIGLFVAWIPWGILWIWGAYRVIKGWLRLSEKRAV
jgi:uncharacterized membrane protein